MNKGTPIKCCPLCGHKIVVSDLFQYSRDYKVTKAGKLSKRYTVNDCGSMEVSVAGCENPECDANWGDGDFLVEDGKFVDFKYSVKNT